MIVHLRKGLVRLKFIVLFIILTYLLYSLLKLVSAWLEPTNRYREPSGNAIKVFEQESGMDMADMGERLKLFYWYGE